MIRKQYRTDEKGQITECVVTFTTHDSIRAERVFLVGDFNGWDERATAMRRTDSGEFIVALKLEPRRRYEYRYLIDDSEWQNDWQADDYVPHPYAGENSVVVT